jgi:S1-C subfamily serine protease
MGWSEAKFGTLDVALVEFNSPRNYQLATFGESQAISEGETVYAAGFPAWHFTQTGDVITGFLRDFERLSGSISRLSKGS